mmetsp:Transcript_3142/g.4523  ORF Transcript_3142/g.4523 Transcript_3142/m.4523 type:complete len:832 (+) Transcript_3142:78-2573(+)
MAEHDAVVMDRKPIMIVPGFMSSGLQVVSSTLVPRWEDKRLWLNLKRLGFTGKLFGTTSEIETNDEDAHSVALRNDWLTHMTLQPDLLTEREGIRVRVVPGLKGVDYLEPGMLTSAASYVFGPVIKALEKAGYADGVDLDAAPYDWRIPPKQLELRDLYFSNTLASIEQLSKKNGDKPVVVLAHSLGALTALYLFQFALKHRGQQWIDERIDTYFVVGGPILGAATSNKSVVMGNNMGLPSAFLSSHQALIMGRSLGSSMFLMPTSGSKDFGSQIDHGCPVKLKPMASPLIKQFSLLTIRVDFVDTSQVNAYFPSIRKLRIRFAVGKIKYDTIWFPPSAVPMIPGAGKHEKSVVFEIPVPPSISEGETLHIELSEPAITTSDVLKPLAGLNPFSSKPRKTANQASLGSLKLAEANILLRDTFRVAQQRDGKTSNYKVDLQPVSTRSNRIGATASLGIGLTYTSCENYHQLHGVQLRSPEQKKNSIVGPEYACYMPIDLLKLEDLNQQVSLWSSEYYAHDSFITTRAPPVKNVYAVYGINLPTEINAVFRRRGGQVSSKKMRTELELDKQAKLNDYGKRVLGYQLKDGVMFETKRTPQFCPNTGVEIGNKCGDGTVPYRSLYHVKTWEDQCNVTVRELEGVNHRKILDDHDFHRILLDYVLTEPEIGRIQTMPAPNKLASAQMRTAASAPVLVSVQACGAAEPLATSQATARAVPLPPPRVSSVKCTKTSFPPAPPIRSSSVTTKAEAVVTSTEAATPPAPPIRSSSVTTTAEAVTVPSSAAAVPHLYPSPDEVPPPLPPKPVAHATEPTCPYPDCTLLPPQTYKSFNPYAS